MRSSYGFPICCESNFYVLVEREFNNTSTGEKVLGVLRPAEDLEKDRNIRRNERGVIDRKQARVLLADELHRSKLKINTYKAEFQVMHNIDASWPGFSRLFCVI